MDNNTWTINLTDTQFKVLEELTGGIIDGGGADLSKDFIQDELGMSVEKFNSVASNLNTTLYMMRRNNQVDK